MRLSHLQVRTPRDDETTIEATSQIIASLLPSSHIPSYKRWFNKVDVFSFEIYTIAQIVYFYVTVPVHKDALVRSLFTSLYPKSLIQATKDPLKIVISQKHRITGELILRNPYFLPIKTYDDFENSVDPLSPLIGFLTRQNPQIQLAIQYIVGPANFAWQEQTMSATVKDIYDSKKQKIVKESTGVDTGYVKKKALEQGGHTCLRLMVASNNDKINLKISIRELANTFGVFSLGAGGNSFSLKQPIFLANSLTKRMLYRELHTRERSKQILNVRELATLWHPPGKLLVGIKNIAWGKTLAGEPPTNLPTIDTIPNKQRQDVNFFATAEFKNKTSIFGIKNIDRCKHLYIIGKTGAGKSTLIANMAIDDIRSGRGLGIIDPHGDLSEIILDFIPKRRINDVVYLEPFNLERPFAFNVLEVQGTQQRDLVASGIVSIFKKIYAESWGPRLEYILRNVVLTLLEVPNTTLADVLPLLSNNDYRNSKILPYVKDTILTEFWTKEFAAMNDKLKTDAISPIQNKVGQFVSGRLIRNIISRPKSTINLEEIMNEGKIMILNLSQGKLGEDNAALLGAMFITQIQLTAMNRAFIPEDQRRNFFLYIDEFQNFATSSFIKILSEARKYRLALTLANQYIDQIDPSIQSAIFGNVGTLISFVVGAHDAGILTKEYAGLYSEDDLVSLNRHEIILKLSIDGMTSAPFPAKTLPLPKVTNNNREKIRRLSLERYGRKIN